LIFGVFTAFFLMCLERTAFLAMSFAVICDAAYAPPPASTPKTAIVAITFAYVSLCLNYWSSISTPSFTGARAASLSALSLLGGRRPAEPTSDRCRWTAHDSPSRRSSTKPGILVAKVALDFRIQTDRG
jgi:hypothetical protein